MGIKLLCHLNSLSIMVIGVLWSERPQTSNILCDSALTKWTRWVALFFNVNWSVRYVKPVWSSTSLWFAPYKIHAQSLWCLFLTQPLTILAFINIYCVMFLTIQTLYFLWAFLLIARFRDESVTHFRVTSIFSGQVFIAKDCLLTGQAQACSRITRLVGCSVFTMPKMA